MTDLLIGTRIKKAYRRKALELHPDRNFGNVEQATSQFADVQTAYEILSDPQERAWYDSHRESILSGSGSGDQYERPSHVTTSEDIYSLLTSFRGQLDYSDTSTGFFGALKNLFHRLAEEETSACLSEGIEPPEYPSFGQAADPYEGNVRSFYVEWGNFSTKKSFSWKDLYRYSEAPDRKVRRLMEKENKRIRDEAIREFNDAVHSLVAFIKKRDPRYKPNKQSEEDRQRTLKEAANAQAARSRANRSAQESLFEQEMPEWMKRTNDDENGDSEEIWDTENEPVKEEFECLLCEKTFKSEKQFEAHEKSKKHTKAVQQIKRQMQKQHRDLQLDDPLSESGDREAEISDDSVDKVTQRKSEVSEATPDSDSLLRQPQAKGESTNIEENPRTQNADSAFADPEASRTDSDGSTESDDDYASQEKMAERILGQNPASQPNPSDPLDSEIDAMSEQMQDQALKDDDDEPNDPRPKMGKAKMKKAKKAAQKAAAATTGSLSEHTCVQCHSTFPSKTRLFAHIKELGHAQPLPSQGSKGGGRGKK